MIIAIDPSGSYKEGDGTTGVVFLDVIDESVKIINIFEVYNKSFKTEQEMYLYYNTFLKEYDKIENYIVMENYLNNPKFSKVFAHGENSTSKVIGIIESQFNYATVYKQPNSIIKTGYYYPNNGLFGFPNLIKYNYLKLDGNKMYFNYDKENIRNLKSKSHCCDALRHGLYFALTQLKIDIYKEKYES